MFRDSIQRQQYYCLKTPGVFRNGEQIVDTLYHVIFRGEIAPGQTLAEVKKQWAQLFSRSFFESWSL